MIGVIELAQVGVLAVYRQGVLGQVVGTNGEEGGFLCQLVGQHGSGGGFHHHANGNILGFDALLGQLCPHLGAQRLGLLQLPHGSHHGEHHHQVAVGRGPENGPELGTENFLPGQADSQTPQTQSGIFFLLKAHIVHLLVRTNVQGTNDHRAVAHGLICSP